MCAWFSGIYSEMATEWQQNGNKMATEWQQNGNRMATELQPAQNSRRRSLTEKLWETSLRVKKFALCILAQHLKFQTIWRWSF